MLFKAFISYSHAADGKLAPAVQRALHGIAKPWYRLRSMRVFRDESNLQTSPGLWSSIETALSQAEFFLYMASPQAAQSPWVQKEIDWWLTHRSWQTFLIVLTDGAIEWDPLSQSLDWSRTTALPPRVGAVCTEEPLYADLRWARNVDQLSARHSQFRPAILNVAAALLNRPKDELDSEDVRQYRRNRRAGWSAASALAVLFILAVASAYYASQQARLATSRALGARSEAVLPTDPELALILAREAVRIRTDEQAELALRQAVAASPQVTIHATQPGLSAAAEFSAPDTVVIRTPDKRAAIWKATTGQRIASLKASTAEFMVSRSAANPVLVIAGESSGFDIYEAATGRELRHLTGDEIQFAGPSALAVRQGRFIRQWRLPSFEESPVVIPVPDEYRMREVSRDGRLILLSNDSEVSPAILVDALTGEVHARLPEEVLREGSLFSPDGTMIVTAPKSEEKYSFDLWDARDGRKIRVLENPPMDDTGWTTYIAFSPNGRTFIAGNRNGMLHSWNVETGKPEGTRTNHRNDILNIQFSRDGTSMLSVAADRTACLWDTSTFRCLATFGQRGDDVIAAGFSSDSRSFLTTHIDGTVRIWDRHLWVPTATFPADTSAVSRDRNTLVGILRGGSIRVWDIGSAQPRSAIPHSSEDLEALAVASPAIASAPVGGPVRIWSGKTTIRLGAPSQKTSALAFTPEGAELATGGEDGIVRWWRVSDGNAIRAWPASKERITGLVVHPDGRRVVVGCWDGSVQVRDIRTGQKQLEARLDEEGSVVQTVALDTAGKLLLFGGDKFGHIWDLDAGVKRRTLTGHTDDVFSAAFSPDNRLILTGSGYLRARGEPPEDGNAVHVWDAASGRQLFSYRAGMPVRTLSFGPGDHTIVAGSMDGTVRLYRCDVCLPLPALLDLMSKRPLRPLSADERAQYGL